MIFWIVSLRLERYLVSYYALSYTGVKRYSKILDTFLGNNALLICGGMVHSLPSILKFSTGNIKGAL